MDLGRGQTLDLSEVLVIVASFADESLLNWLTEVVEGDGKSKKKSKNSSNAKAKKNVQKDLLSNASQRLLGKVNKVMNSLKAIGKPEPVTITWCAHQQNSC